MTERESVFAFRDLLDAADLVTALAASEDESPEVDEAFVAAVVRLRDVANAARPCDRCHREVRREQ